MVVTSRCRGSTGVATDLDVLRNAATFLMSLGRLDEALACARRFLSYLPSHNRQAPPAERAGPGRMTVSGESPAPRVLISLATTVC